MPTFEITKEFEFEAAHHLPALPDGHKCKRPHGHSYIVRLHLTATELDDHGFVKDFGELREFKAVVEALDHQDLNKLLPFYPTAELLALHLLERATELYGDLVASVGVSETRKTWAVCRR
jgi:6-pyruvoyltetrahydropterin/6-carboxytetrahydropterin synthase